MKNEALLLIVIVVAIIMFANDLITGFQGFVMIALFRIVLAVEGRAKQKGTGESE